MAKELDFIFDFGSPNAYLSYSILSPILERTGATLNLIPCLLGGIFKATGNQPPMIAFGNIKGKLDYDMLEMRRFIERYNLNKFKMNPHFPINTLLVMRALVAAQMEGDTTTYVEAILKGMWEDGEKLDDPDVIIRVLTDAGLDGASLLEKTQDPAVKQRLMDNTSAAVERGVFGVPTFFVGNEMFFGKDRLDQVEEALASS